MGGSDKVKETEYEKELAKVYGEQFAYYQENIIPVENRVMAEAKASNDGSIYHGISEDVNLGYEKSFGEAGKKTLSNLASQGVDPSSGKSREAIGSLANVGASVKADATSRAQISGQERYIDKSSNIMAMGQGQSQNAVSSLNDIAVNSQRKANSDASIASQNKYNIHSAIGGIGGAYASNSFSAPSSTDANPDRVFSGNPVNQSNDGNQNS